MQRAESDNEMQDRYLEIDASQSSSNHSECASSSEFDQQAPNQKKKKSRYEPYRGKRKICAITRLQKFRPKVDEKVVVHKKC